MKQFSSLSKIRTALSGFVLTSLIAGFLCISFVYSTPAHVGMASHGIHKSPSATINSCCDAGVSDHMELWKSTLVGIPQNLQNLLALFAVSLVAGFTFLTLLNVPRTDGNIFAIRYRQYTREHPDISLFDSLRLAYSKGILNPKLY